MFPLTVQIHIFNSLLYITVVFGMDQPLELRYSNLKFLIILTGIFFPEESGHKKSLKKQLPGLGRTSHSLTE